MPHYEHFLCMVNRSGFRRGIHHQRSGKPFVHLRTLVASAITGGVVAVVIGLPLATLAMLPPGTNIGSVSFGYNGWEGTPPVVVWSIIALATIVGAVLVCSAAALFGRQVRVKVGHGTPNILLAGVLLTWPCGGSAQVPRVVPGWGVDTSGVAPAWSDVARAQDVRAIYLRWSQYLSSNPGQFAPTTLWAEEDQRRWLAFDLSASIAYQGFPATVLEITPVSANVRDKYVVRTLFSTATGNPPEVKPIALTRVYAIRRGSDWVFTNVISDDTRDWRRERVGRFTYVIEPGYPFDRARAERAVTFADSLADVFQLPRPEQLTYYLARGREPIHRIMGVEWTVGGTGAGYASAANRLIFSGEPGAGENCWNRSDRTEDHGRVEPSWSSWCSKLAVSAP